MDSGAELIGYAWKEKYVFLALSEYDSFFLKKELPCIEPKDMRIVQVTLG